MLLLTSTSDKLQVVTGSSGSVDVHASYIDLASGTVTAGRLNSKISTATTTDVVASPGASTTRNVKALHVANVHASTSNLVTIQHTDGTNVIQLEQVTLLAGERMSYREGVGMRVIDVNGFEKTNPVLAIGQYSVSSLASAATNATTTASKVTSLDYPTPTGTVLFEYYLRWRNATAANGIKLSVNHTGTVTSFVYDLYGVDNIATAATGAMDQDALASTGQVMTAWAARAKAATGTMPVLSADTAASDMFLMITGMATITVVGNLELWFASRGAATSASIEAGSALRLTKVG